MVELDIERLNSTTPYQVVRKRNRTYTFCTDSGLTYYLFFDDDDLVSSDTSYQFTILNADDLPSPSDMKLRQTVVEVILEFFRCNNATMLYMCETADGRQETRSRLFAYWFNASPKHYEFTFLQSAVEDSEGVLNYISLISRNDNPNLHRVLEEWGATLKVLSHKPRDI